MSHISGGLQPAISLYDTAIKRMRAMKKSKTNPLENILPELAAMAPVPDDATAMMETVAAITDPTTRLELGRQAVEAGKKYKPKNILKDIKELAIENPITTATLGTVGAGVAAREASYTIPLQVRSYLRSMSKLSSVQTRLPARYTGRFASELPYLIRSALHDITPASAFSDLEKYPHLWETAPPVKELVNRGVFKETTPLLPITVGTGLNSELFNTLGKYYIHVDPENKIVHIFDYYKFYPWANFGEKSKEHTIQLLNKVLGSVKSSIVGAARLKVSPKAKLKALIQSPTEIGTDALEALGIKHGGEFPIHWKIKATPQMIKAWNDKLMLGEENLLRDRFVSMSKNPPFAGKKFYKLPTTGIGKKYLKVKWHDLSFTYEDLKSMGYKMGNLPTDPKLKKLFLEGAGVIPKTVLKKVKR